MTASKPAANLPVMLSLEGDVLEIFQGLHSDGAHVALIDSIELQTDKKGVHRLVVTTHGGAYGTLVDEEAVAKVTKLIADVVKARAAAR